ncbi:MAG TPA: thiamine pyrophosphate-dependent enzyme [Ignavibacteria bacterium]|nr:thiamine pyrophosphate-dependent enzyme [Ignavibacteria bacterium]
MTDKKILLKAFASMCTSKKMAEIYDDNKQICKYVHSTSRGHEAIQLAVGMQLRECDLVSPYYRDESILLGIGLEPYELMLQLLTKRDDPFSGGRTYYGHPSLRRDGFPKIPHQSSATGMQAIPATGAAHGIHYLESAGLLNNSEDIENNPVIVCSLGDGSVTEGEVSEAFQMAVLKKLPIIYLIQDNQWGISAYKDEMRAMDAYEFAAGFKGMKRIRIDGSDFKESYTKFGDMLNYVRTKRKPVLIHAAVPLLGHHTSGVRKEWYRNDIDEHTKDDPIPKLRKVLLKEGVSESDLLEIEKNSALFAEESFAKAVAADEPSFDSLTLHEFAPTPVTEEKGERSPAGKESVIMVDAGLYAVREIMDKHPEAILYGQDVGARLGGVFREAATLAQRYGDNRVFNTPIQEAYIVGSTAGMSAVGVRPIVEIQFADYAWAGINQLVVELSKSCYLTMGKYPVSCVIRIPCGAYGAGGPFHSDCIESSLLPIRGIKIAFPSNAADMKGLMKSAFYDPNPVIMLEHKGLYWSKVPGTDAAKCIEPSEDYIIPFGKGRIFQYASEDKINSGESLSIITYGMGVHWALNASKDFPGSIEIVDLRTLNPIDEELMYESVKRHGKCIVLTEEQVLNSFAESLAGRISKNCFQYLDAPVEVVGSVNMPAVPLNSGLESMMLPNKDKVSKVIGELLGY